MEVNEFQKALVNEALFLRGQIIAGYSMVEYVLADISVRLNHRFPYRIKARIEAVKKIADRQEYEGYRHDLHRVCDQLLRYEDLRKFMAHGALSVTTDKKQTSHKFVIRRYDEVEGKPRRFMEEFSVEDLREAASELVKYLNDAYAVFYKFYNEQAVETFDHPDNDDA
jgi:hypothetical protein